MEGMFRRTELLMGPDYMRRLSEMRVIIFGVGGVGSWCAESLVRSGVRHLTIVDSDRVCVTNVNRQLMATTRTVGQVKVDALKIHLLDINPEAEIVSLQKIYSSDNAEEFHLENYHYIVDAIDSLKDKVDLILRASRLSKQNLDITLVSSMGAALRTDPFAIRKAEFWDVQGDPLAKMLRKRFKHMGQYPARKFLCVYSLEPARTNLGQNHSCGTDHCLCPKAKLIQGQRGSADALYDAPGDQRLVEHEWCTTKAQINGTMAHVTIMFGTALAGIILQDVEHRMKAQ